MVIKIYCKDVIGEGVINMLSAMEAAARANHPKGDFDEGLFTMELNPVDPKPKVEGEQVRDSVPRIQYRALLAGSPKNKRDKRKIEEAIEKNMRELGATTMTGIVYRDIVNRTLVGEYVTEPQIRRERSLKAGSSQRVIGDLCRQGLLEKVPVIHGG